MELEKEFKVYIGVMENCKEKNNKFVKRNK